MQGDTSAGFDEVVGTVPEPGLRYLWDGIAKLGEINLKVSFRAYRCVACSLVEQAVG